MMNKCFLLTKFRFLILIFFEQEKEGIALPRKPGTSLKHTRKNIHQDVELVFCNGRQ